MKITTTPIFVQDHYRPIMNRLKNTIVSRHHKAPAIVKFEEFIDGTLVNPEQMFILSPLMGSDQIIYKHCTDT